MYNLGNHGLNNGLVYYFVGLRHSELFTNIFLVFW